MIYQTDNFGAQPSGKAAVFDTAILGSNPSAPAKLMKKKSLNISFINKLKNIFFPFYRSNEIKRLFKILEKEKAKTLNIIFIARGGS